MISVPWSIPRAAAEDRAPWSATWTASPQPLLTAEDGFDRGLPMHVADQTMRQIVRVSVGGRAVRVVISNAHGTSPLVIGEARVARSAGGAARCEIPSVPRA